MTGVIWGLPWRTAAWLLKKKEQVMERKHERYGGRV